MPEIRRAEAVFAAGFQHPCHLAKMSCGVGHMLQDEIRDTQIERLRGEWKDASVIDESILQIAVLFDFLRHIESGEISERGKKRARGVRGTGSDFQNGEALRHMTSYQVEKSRCSVYELRVEEVVSVKKRISHGSGQRSRGAWALPR